MAFRNCLCLTNSWVVSDGPGFLLSGNSVPDCLMGCNRSFQGQQFLDCSQCPFATALGPQGNDSLSLKVT